MTDPASSPPTPPPSPSAVPGVTSPPDATPPNPPVTPVTRSKWLGVLALIVVMALLTGATAMLFVRVQQAHDRADEAVVLAGNQSDALDARLAALDAQLASASASATTTNDDVAAVRRQVNALRKCVNDALDAWAQATQAGKPASITKC